MEAFLNSLLTVNGLAAIVEILLAVIVSFLADWIPGFTELSKRAKRLYWLLVPMLVAFGVTFMLAWLKHVAVTGEDAFLALSVGALTFYGSQFAETRDLSTTRKTLS